jgi:predicted nucleotidyltransferase
MIELIREKLPEIRELCLEFNVKRLEIFGSAVTDEFTCGSDIDFLVEFKALEQGHYADTYFGLLEAIKAVLGCEVDLVMASAIKNPYFLRAIKRNKELLYAA